MNITNIKYMYMYISLYVKKKFFNWKKALKNIFNIGENPDPCFLPLHLWILHSFGDPKERIFEYKESESVTSNLQEKSSALPLN